MNHFNFDLSRASLDALRNAMFVSPWQLAGHPVLVADVRRTDGFELVTWCQRCGLDVVGKCRRCGNG